MRENTIHHESRIAVFLQDLKGGGAERAMVNIANGMSRQGVPVDLVLVRREGPYLHNVDEAVRVVDLGSKRVSTSLFALIRYLRRVRPSGLLSTLVHVNVLAVAAARLSGTGTRVVVREANDIEHNMKVVLPLVRMCYQIAPIVYRMADGVVAISDGLRMQLIDKLNLDPHKVHRIYNPVDIPTIRRGARDAPEHPWLQAGEPPVILAVGRLARQKGFDVLVKAFAMVRRQCAVRLIILGEGPERNELLRLAADLQVLDDISLPGFVRNPHAYMARCGVFVLSSRWEGFGNVLVEALTTGAKIVATDCPHGPSEILRNGEEGILVAPDDADELAVGILRTLVEGDRGLREAETEKSSIDPVALDRFAFSTIRSQYLELMRPMRA